MHRRGSDASESRRTRRSRQRPRPLASGANAIASQAPHGLSNRHRANQHCPCPYPLQLRQIVLDLPTVLWLAYCSGSLETQTRCPSVARREPAPSRQVGSLVHFFLVYRLLRRQLSSRSSTTLGAEAPTVLRYTVSSVHIDVTDSPRGPRRLRPRTGVWAPLRARSSGRATARPRCSTNTVVISAREKREGGHLGRENEKNGWPTKPTPPGRDERARQAARNLPIPVWNRSTSTPPDPCLLQDDGNRATNNKSPDTHTFLTGAPQRQRVELYTKS